MKPKQCFLIGRRDAPESLYPALRRAIELHIEKHGVLEFVVGKYGAFDRMAARAVSEAKRTRPYLRLTLLLPYHPGKRREDFPSEFDGSWYPFGDERVPPRAAILRADRIAAAEAEYLIAWAPYPDGNARGILEFARKRGDIRVTELDMPDPDPANFPGVLDKPGPDGV